VLSLVSSDNDAHINDGVQWYRHYIVFDVAQAQPVTVGFWTPYWDQVGVPFTVAAPMLEKVIDQDQATSSTPRPFEDTTESGTVMRSVCEDTSGTVFRGTRWDEGSVKLCADGYSTDCRSQANTYTYHQTSFGISQRAIEEGGIFKQSGFARGNYNYRIESVGLNFVGTGVRSCADTNLPSTCYSGGYIPYTIIHEGPYYVRNHMGEDFEAKLFTGSIEHARGLATERYLTNPLSSADQSLLEPYFRTELRGRPLDGTFVVRVWDEPGVDFNGIQDVQIVIKYRYWTRFE
jgi:hypothetical protein